MRRPWMIIGVVGGSLGILVVALAPTIAVVLVGWCIAQLFFNALLAAMVAVLPDQVPVAQRGLVSGALGVCLPLASVAGTFLVQLFTGNQLAMFLVPCAIGGFFVLLFAVSLRDRRLNRDERPAWSLREFASTFYVNPLRNPDFAWAFASRFLFVLAYAFLVTYQVYYLLEKIGSAQAEVPRQVFLGHRGPVRHGRRRLPARWETVGPDGPTEDLRRRCVDRVRPGDVHGGPGR